jgi:NAD(P)-dependent dehydrogenase (short-subunit alcohol dehydrogenase family)
MTGVRYRRSEIAPAYVFLAAPVCASYITGIVLPVMGGVIGATEP